MRKRQLVILGIVNFYVRLLQSSKLLRQLAFNDIYLLNKQVVTNKHIKRMCIRNEWNCGTLTP